MNFDPHSEMVQSLNFLTDDPETLLVMIFGSTAGGSHRPDSDIDVAVYSRQKLDGRKRQRLADQIACATGRTVDLIDLADAEGALLRQILRTGKVIFSKAPGILGILHERLLDWQEDFEPQLDALLESRLQQFTASVHGS